MSIMNYRSLAACACPMRFTRSASTWRSFLRRVSSSRSSRMSCSSGVSGRCDCGRVSAASRSREFSGISTEPSRTMTAPASCASSTRTRSVTTWSFVYVKGLGMLNPPWRSCCHPLLAVAHRDQPRGAWQALALRPLDELRDRELDPKGIAQGIAMLGVLILHDVADDACRTLLPVPAAPEVALQGMRLLVDLDDRIALLVQAPEEDPNRPHALGDRDRPRLETGGPVRAGVQHLLDGRDGTHVTVLLLRVHAVGVPDVLEVVAAVDPDLDLPRDDVRLDVLLAPHVLPADALEDVDAREGLRGDLEPDRRGVQPEVPSPDDRHPAQDR